jgi:hypothetical protein
VGVIYGCEDFIPSGVSSSSVIHNSTLAFTHWALWNWFHLTADILGQPLNRTGMIAGEFSLKKAVPHYSNLWLVVP